MSADFTVEEVTSVITFNTEAVDGDVSFTLDDSTESTSFTVETGKGDKGDQGLDGDIVYTFEAVSKNLQNKLNTKESWDYTLNYTAGTLTSIDYTDGTNTVTKTLNYDTNGTLISVVLSGDTPAGIELTKTLGYDSNGTLISVTYS